MAKIIENKTEVCKYVDYEKRVKELSDFNWVVSSKVLLNKFGNPLSTNEKVDEDDLKEKCSYELHLVREIEDSSVIKVAQLQNEYEANPLKDNSFGGGRVTGCVFLSLLFFGTLFPSISCFSMNLVVGGWILLIIAILAGLGITAIIWTGIVSVINANEENIVIQQKRDQIAEQARNMM